MKKLVVLFALAALSTTAMARYSDGQKETVAAGAAPGTTAETTARETNSETTTVGEAMVEENAAKEGGENYDTGDASLNNTRNQGKVGENGFLVVSFGTSYNDNRRLTVGAIKDAIEKAFSDYSARRGFISQTIIDHVRSRDRASIDNMGEASDHVVNDKVKNLVIQPTHLVNGLEYTDLVNEVTKHPDASEEVTMGGPLLTTDDGFEAVIRATTEVIAEYDNGETTICFTGHGTEAEFSQVYSKVQDMLIDTDYNSYYVGAVEASPTVKNVLVAVQTGGYKKVVLEPLTIVTGDRASSDMVGDEGGSWEKAFENAEYEVTCLVRGLEEMEAIQQLFVEHAKAAAKSLSR